MKKILSLLFCGAVLLAGCKTNTIPSGAHKMAGEDIINQEIAQKEAALSELNARTQQLEECQQSKAFLEAEYVKTKHEAAELKAELMLIREQIASANQAAANAEAERARIEAEAARYSREKAEAEAEAARAKAEADAMAARAKAESQAAAEKARQDSIEAAKKAIPDDAEIKVKKENFELVNPTSDQTVEGFHIVVGSFGVETNANRLHTLLTEQGNQPSIARNENGMYRVIIATEDSYAAATRRVASVRAAGYPDAWVLMHN